MVDVVMNGWVRDGEGKKDVAVVRKVRKGVGENAMTTR